MRMSHNKLLSGAAGLDAILLEQEGYSALALNGLHINKLMEKLYRQPVSPDLHLLLLLDNDEDGQKAEQDVAKRLIKTGVTFSLYDYLAADGVSQSFLKGFKDIRKS
ncbi:hypothetical protein EBB07_12365 [Paenibacillaceae bacterium]|nr:hypothetical protein EBB07_12365 [Paenibacillaceae bacterium]